MSLVRRIFITASIACGAAFVTKIVLIAANGGEWNLAIGIMWGVGMVTCLVAAATGVALALRSRPVWVRVVASIAAVPIAFAALDWLHVLVKSVYKADGWFRDEVALVVAGVALATIGLAMLANRREATPNTEPRQAGSAARTSP